MAENGMDAFGGAPQAVASMSTERSAGKAGSAPVYSQLAALLREKIGLAANMEAYRQIVEENVAAYPAWSRKINSLILDSGMRDQQIAADCGVTRRTVQWPPRRWQMKAWFPTECAEEDPCQTLVCSGFRHQPGAGDRQHQLFAGPLRAFSAALC